MRQVSCRNCGNRVLIEKYSNAHTSVQWLEDSAQVCPELARPSDNPYAQRSCSSLRQTINDLADAGAVEMSERSYPVPGSLY
ncbi:hypothetical protein [Rhodococcus globerulus]|uniref:Uncharacterized protein n=1 Tax=Rhodococcus globerulus TaxID=33008 RepID=A0ABU4BQP0_RHOGO|nr:hypothetical protein [Rhodococcus globerulus]MCE4264351.1 hypothetical protein [Rhodococcus globerulus]MDV6266494.1 hypothetical protein [Rhodococcus globerulus]